MSEGREGSAGPIMERSEHLDNPSAEPDRADLREAVGTTARARRPRKAHPPAERIDVADVHRELIARYPKIRAKLAE